MPPRPSRTRTAVGVYSCMHRPSHADHGYRMLPGAAGVRPRVSYTDSRLQIVQITRARPPALRGGVTPPYTAPYPPTCPRPPHTSGSPTPTQGSHACSSTRWSPARAPRTVRARVPTTRAATPTSTSNPAGRALRSGAGSARASLGLTSLESFVGSTCSQALPSPPSHARLLLLARAAVLPPR